jgi:hypothetical protein
MNFKEHQILTLLNQKGGHPYFPAIYDGGTFEVAGLPTQSFIIIEMLGNNLEYYLLKKGRPFSLKTVC